MINREKIAAPKARDEFESHGDAHVARGGREQPLAAAESPALIDLSTLDPETGFVIQGDAASDRAGFSVSDAGDVNGDGFDDVIVGALYNDDGGYEAGAAYVIFGKASGFGTVDLSNLGSAGFAILGGTYDYAGQSVSSAGDVNGDGFGDVIVGDYRYGFVVFGQTGNGADIDLATIAPADGFVLAQGYSGIAVSSAGDINGDGFDDMLVGSRYSNYEQGSDLYGSGRTYVVFGRNGAPGTPDFNGRSVLDLPSMSAADGFAITGEANEDRSGISVSSAGDFNGDGFDDIIIGAPGNDDGGVDAGAAYVIFGKASGFSDIDLGNLAAAAGFVIQGDAAGDALGAVSSAGDFNGDGLDDLIVGAPLGDNGGSFAGEAYVIFGRDSGFGLVDLSNLSLDDGFVVEGATGDKAGFSVSGAGDVDNDGFDDIIIGAPTGNNGGSLAGEAYVIFGGPAAAETITGTNGADKLEGGDAGEVLRGLGGNDTLDGGGGGDTLEGGAGLDWADYSDSLRVIADLQIPAGNNRDALGDVYVSIENLRGGALADNLRGNAGANRIEGGARNDTLSGRSGDDTLVGGPGFDQLAGQQGIDSILLTSTDPADYDRIVGFADNETILLDGTAFRLAPGALDPDAFVLGNGARDAQDRLIYLESVGKLFYDPDGAGGAGRELIAIIENRPDLDASHFIVI